MIRYFLLSAAWCAAIGTSASSGLNMTSKEVADNIACIGVGASTSGTTYLAGNSNVLPKPATGISRMNEIEFARSILEV